MASILAVPRLGILQLAAIRCQNSTIIVFTVHPGEILREDVFPALGLSVSEASRRLGVSRQQLHRILACTHPITVEMALRIGRLVGNGPGLWLRMQQNHDLWRMEQGLRGELEKITPADTTSADLT